MFKKILLVCTLVLLVGCQTKYIQDINQIIDRSNAVTSEYFSKGRSD